MARIMIVDHSRENNEILSLALKVIGHEAIVARGGADALELAEKHRPDVVLLDLMMPGMDGYETLRHLRARPAISGLPVIVFTASEEADIGESVTKAGANACLSKPVSLDQLKMAIDAQLNSHRLMASGSAE